MSDRKYLISAKALRKNEMVKELFHASFCFVFSLKYK